MSMVAFMIKHCGHEITFLIEAKSFKNLKSLGNVETLPGRVK